MDEAGGRAWVLLHFTFVRVRDTIVTNIKEISGEGDTTQLSIFLATEFFVNITQ